jgi:putative addiction module component (TIGR02574 family)
VSANFPHKRLIENVMLPTLQELGLDRLEPEERLALADALWESVSHEMQAAEITPLQRLELERRLADSIDRPEAVTPWEEIKARALSRRKG